MPNFRCPGNEVDGPCGTIIEGKRRPEPNSEIAVLYRHINKITKQVCRRRYVWFKDHIPASEPKLKVIK